MKSPEQQAIDVAKEKEELLARTIKITLSTRQQNTIKEIKSEQAQLNEKFVACTKREQDIINFTLDFKDIKEGEVESVSFEEGMIIVVKKAVEPIETVSMIPSKAEETPGIVEADAKAV